MDAKSAAAMWQEANCPVRARCIILQLLFNFFERWITVPEQNIRDLELGVLQPKTDSVTIDGKGVCFWYKDIDEAIKNWTKMELQCRGSVFFK